MRRGRDHRRAPVAQAGFAALLAGFAALLATLAGSLIAAPDALADAKAPAPITFTEGYVNPGDYLDATYQISAGVTFGTPSTLGFPGSVPAGIGECDPYLMTVGGVNAAGESQCGSGEFPTPAGFMFQLEYARSTVSFSLRALNAALGQPEAGAQAIAYDHDGNPVADFDLTAGQAAAWSTVTLTTGPPVIQYVEVNGLGTGAGIELTNLTLPATTGAGLTPYWKLTDLKALPVDFQNGMINVVAHDNETLTIPLQILRENGSTGSIVVSASDGANVGLSQLTVDNSPSGAPAGVVDLILKPAGGFDGSYVNVTMSGTADGTAGAYDGVPLTFHVVIKPEFTITASADAVGVDCLSSIGLVLTSQGSYTGPVTVTGTDTTGLHHFSKSVNVTGPGQYQLSDGVTAGYYTLSYAVSTTTAVNVATTTFVPPVQTVSMDSNPASTPVPEGGLVRFAAAGLPCDHLVLRTAPTDGNPMGPAPTVNSATFQPSASSFAQNYAIALNPVATSGPAEIYDLDTDKDLVDLGDLTVTSFRNTYGFSWQNGDYGMRMDDSMEDELFGSDQTNIDVLGWQVRKPEAWMYEQITNNHIPGGICFGMAYSSLEFYDFPQERSQFAPSAGLTNPWEFDSPDRPSDGLLRYVIERFSLQFTDQLIPVALNASIGSHGPDDDINLIKAQLATGQPVPIGMAEWSGISLAGHTVLAYATQDLPDGSTAVLVANSNEPYLTSEETNLSQHVTREQTNSEIIIKNGNWSFPELGWSGSEADLVVYTHDELPIINGQRPALPSVFTSTPVLVFGSGGDSVTQLTGAHGTALFSDGALAPRTQWPAGVAPLPVFTSHASPLQLVALTPAAGAQSLSASVRRSGRGGSMAMELPGLEAELSTGGGANTIDHVTVNAAADAITYAAGSHRAPLTGVLLSRPAAATATAAAVEPDQLVKFATTSTPGGSDRFSDRHGAFAVSHTGPTTTMSVALSAFTAQGLPVEVRLPTMRLKAGETVTATPRWSALGHARVPLAITVNGHTRHTSVAARSLARPFARLLGATIAAPATGAATLTLRFAHTRFVAGRSLAIAATVRRTRGVLATSTPARIVPAANFSGSATIALSARLSPGRYVVRVRVLESSGDEALQSAAIVSRVFRVRVGHS